ncbi:LysM peptidoglycan-binding domain-containing protein [Modestobacter italicus]|uniref:LysM peptidoglycan-binding domain-containing protein n=1 Tax=Modestobacter italicus (strain DSM 44449 / CECT 9708 / BC 501) TaxID=2732864 RepID=UPI003F766EB1
MPRWMGTVAAMCGAGWLLAVLGAAPAEVRAAAQAPQQLVDTAGPDALVVAVVTALAWLCWSWGALGLLLTAATAVPGWAGRLAGVLLSGVLPAGARRAAALAIGVGLSATAPLAAPGGSATVAVTTAAAERPAGDAPGLLDWPAQSAGLDWPAAPDRPTAPSPGPPVPDWPSAPPDGHVVLRGDCLWDIARDHLTGTGGPATDAAVAAAVQAWWHTNAAVIGPDPDLLLPGQVLQPPPP